jgi:formylglycine-generating enzyme required for sulfatase activity
VHQPRSAEAPGLTHATPLRREYGRRVVVISPTYGRANHSRFSDNGQGNAAVASLHNSHHPAEWVTWYEATEFCGDLGQQEELKLFYFQS